MFIFASVAALLAACGAACGAPEGPWKPRPYYDIYDEAVNLYYKPPRRPEQALTLMERACRQNQDGQDILCYNLGVLLELEAASKKRILAAYERAGSIRPHPLYTAAIQRLRPNPGAYESEYLQSLVRMTVACREERPDRALRELRKAIEAAESGGRPSQETRNDSPDGADAPQMRPQLSAPPGGREAAGTPAAPGSQIRVPLPRESFAQPFFAECLAGTKHTAEYQDLLDRLTPAGGDLETQLIQARARLDPFHNIWDVELNLRGLRDGSTSKNPATAEWHDFVQSARRGQAAGAALHLRAFFDGLDALAREAARTPGGDAGHRRTATRQQVRAFKRGAAVLIQNDPYFHRVRGQAAVQKIVRPLLK